MTDSTSKITVHIDASDLAAFRELVERAERAAERTRVLTALRLPLRPRTPVEETYGVDPDAKAEKAAKPEPIDEHMRRAIEDRIDFFQESATDAAHRRITQTQKRVERLEGFVFEDAALAKRVEAIESKLASLVIIEIEPRLLRLERWSREQQDKLAALESSKPRDTRDEEIATLKLELAAWRKEHAAREQEIAALKKTIAHADDSRRELRSKIEVESAEHFATRIALRDALRAAAEHAREAADCAATRGEHAYAKDVREIAATYDTARAALGLDTITMPPMPQAPAAGS